MNMENANNPVVTNLITASTANGPAHRDTNIITNTKKKSKTKRAKNSEEGKRPSLAYTITTFDNHSLCVESFTHYTIDFVSIFQPFSFRSPQGNKLRKVSWMRILNDTSSCSNNKDAQVDEKEKVYSRINGRGRGRCRGRGRVENTSSVSGSNGGSSNGVTLPQLEAFIACAIQTKFYGGDEEEDAVLYNTYQPCYQYAFRNTKLFKRMRKQEERQAARFEQNNIDSGGKSRTNSKYRYYKSRTELDGSSEKQEDELNFSDFRMFSVYLCIYAQLFDIFVPRVTANANAHDTFEGANTNAEHEGAGAKSSGEQNDKDRALNPKISIQDYLERHESFDDFNFKVLDECDTMGKAVALFDDIDTDETGFINFSQWCARIKREEVKHQTKLGALLMGHFATSVHKFPLQQINPNTGTSLNHNSKANTYATLSTTNTQSRRASKQSQSEHRNPTKDGSSRRASEGDQRKRQSKIVDAMDIIKAININASNHSAHSKRPIDTVILMNTSGHTIMSSPSRRPSWTKPNQPCMFSRRGSRVSAIDNSKSNSKYDITPSIVSSVSSSVGYHSTNAKQIRNDSRIRQIRQKRRNHRDRGRHSPFHSSTSKVRSSGSKSNLISLAKANKFRVIMPIKIAGAFKPPRDASGDLKDFLRSFQPYAEKFATSIALRRRGFASHANDTGLWTLQDVKAFIYDTIQQDKLVGNTDKLFDLFEPSYQIAFENAIDLKNSGGIKKKSEGVGYIDGADDDSSSTDSITFKEFRMLNAFVCIYATILETFLSVHNDGINYSSGVHLEYVNKVQWIDGCDLMKKGSFVMLQHVSDVHIAHEVFKRMDGQRHVQEDEDDDGIISFSTFCRHVKEEEIASNTALGKLLAGTF